jgi:uncharacterized membrane protein
MNPAHVHLLLNHVPVLTTAFGMIVLIVALLRRNRTMIHLSYTTFVLTALITIPAYLSGRPAEHVVKHLPGVAEEFIGPHEDAAVFAFGGSILLGVLSIAAIYHSYRTKRNAPAMGWLVFATSLWLTTVMARVAYLGGEIRHTEIRSGETVNGSDSSGENR